MATPRFTARFLISCAAVFTTAAFARAETVFYSAGHGDIRIEVFDDDGGPQLRPFFHFDNTAILDGERVPAPLDLAAATVLTSVPHSATLFVDAPWLGRSAGDTVNLIEAGQRPGSPFLGFGAENLSPSDWSGPLTLSLVGMRAPEGENVAIWQFQFQGVFTAWESVGGIENSAAVPIPAGGHDHFNLGFTAPGIYELDLVASGNHTTLGNLTGPPTTLTFVVAVPEPGTVALLALGSIGVVIFHRRRMTRARR
ncbi:MAG: choice-of-anchor M domain-containing protein [Chthoniobacterales bacterium]